ncbi:MAG: hypothetical protein Fur0032_07220 [Terrimicrobiaceae bacterium]
MSCHRCGRTHEVSFFAKSTFCPGCSTAITFEDLTIAANASRPVDIRGKLTVKPGITLTSPLVVCTDAVIEGRLAGAIFCERRLEIRGNGRLTFRVQAATIRILKGVELSCTVPLEAGEIEVAGSLVGHLRTRHAKVTKTGLVHGDIDASAVIVERGGEWIGHGRVGAA